MGRKRYLQILEHLDTSDETDRRIAVDLVYQHHRQVLTEVGEEIGLSGIHDQMLNKQWERIYPRLESHPETDIPDRYEFIRKLYEFRNSVQHNTKKDIPEEQIESLVNKADEWHEWITSRADAYKEYHEELSPYDQVVTLIQNTVDQALNPDELAHYPPYGELYVQADELKSDLNELVSEQSKDEITLDLAYVLRKATRLESKLNNIERDWLELKEELIILREKFGIGPQFTTNEAGAALGYYDVSEIRERLYNLLSVGYLDAEDPDPIVYSRSNDSADHNFSDVIEALKRDLKYSPIRRHVAKRCGCNQTDVESAIDSLESSRQVELVNSVLDNFQSKIGKDKEIETVGRFQHYKIFIPEPDNWYLTDNAIGVKKNIN